MSSTDSKIESAVPRGHPLPPVPMSTRELAAYFPHHATYPEIMFRYHRNGWNLAQIAKAQLIARDAYDQDTFTKRAQSMRQQIGTAGNEKYGIHNFSASDVQWRGHPDFQPFTNQGSAAANQALYDISRANPPVLPPSSVRPLHAATLAQVANGVVEHPSGEDAGMFTAVIRWALYHGVADQYTTDDVMSIVNNPVNHCAPPSAPSQRLNVLPAGASTHRWDQDCRDRVQAIARPW
ncbi:hypothetical protein TI39_contig490g00002 [Zymoseptoria brevis]|uniref:Uncharacterized protein n=1 Tax=Zymoseptoria brevis TaxID=1047168 RepID=A0A0F4GJA4_9PEZI|nr:hypothetical protein TI39_contig490g00002 [Zymoseptoria brevis]